MKVLTATRKTQNAEKGDICYASEGELVFRAQRCDSDSHPDCRCSKSLAGTRTRNFTNTVLVEDKDYFIDQTDALHESIRGLREIAEQYETGSVLEVQPDGFLLREGAHIWQEHFLD